MTIQRLIRVTMLCLGLFIGLVSTTMLSRSSAQLVRPDESEVRGLTGVPTGTALRSPVLSPVKALTALQAIVRDTIPVYDNELTATPRSRARRSGLCRDPLPNNTTTFDVGSYIIEGSYNAKPGGSLEGAATGSVLQGRRAYTGTKGLHHVRIALGSFAPGGANNPNSLPVFLRFRMTSDVATAIGGSGGWYIDNLVIDNLSPAGCPLATTNPNDFSNPHASSLAAAHHNVQGSPQPCNQALTSDLIIGEPHPAALLQKRRQPVIG